MPTIEPTAPSLLPTQEPTRAYTPGKCCHAGENTDLYEEYCNRWNFINECLSRHNHVKCDFFIKIETGCDKRTYGTTSVIQS